MTKLKAVALGGGHGLHATLTALQRVTDDVTAVVTVADDGGSSGRLRRELGTCCRRVTCARPWRRWRDRTRPASCWTSLFKHRFGGTGALAGHAVGNLVLAGLLEQLGDPVAVLDLTSRLLGVQGRVLPMSNEPLDIEADVVGLDEDETDVRRIRGQVAIATTPGLVQRIRLTAPNGRPAGCPEAVQAVLDADVVLLGPGSWFTSVLPHLLVPELHDALVRTRGQEGPCAQSRPPTG